MASASQAWSRPEENAASHAGSPGPSRGSNGSVMLKQAVRAIPGMDAQEAMLAPSASASSTVQRQSESSQSGDTDSVHRAAEAGISGGASPLPHGDAIQQAFGRHDVSQVQAHVGGRAAEGASAMGAEAFASGSHVAFREAPSLHTAAHEAAHVVQQRGGVQLQGGVGEVGDPYERHADQVADAVVAGRSAEGMLDPFAGGGGGGSVQRRVVQRIPVPPDIEAMTIDQCKAEAEAMYVGTGAYASRGILDHKLDAANDMRVDLGRSDPVSVTAQIALAALQVGVAAGAAALSVGTGGLAAALIAGGAAVITALPGFFSGGGNVIDSTTFVSDYISTTRQGWPTSVSRLHAQMASEATARQVCAQTRALRDNPGHVKQVQRNEILDEWMTATANAHAGSTSNQMGGASYDDASEGRLHLETASIGTAAWNFSTPRTATMEGVGLEKLRHFNLNRRIIDIKCPRTMKVLAMYGELELAMTPTDTVTFKHSDLGWAKMVLSSYYLQRVLDEDDMGIVEGGHDQDLIDANYMNGARKMWDQVKNQTLSGLGISSIGN